MNRRLVIFAPNVASGGGLVLLKAMIAAWPANTPVAVILDERGRTAIGSDISKIEHYWVKSSVVGRLTAERMLRKITKPGDVVLCFHNLPPLFVNLGKVLCYVHNPNIVGLVQYGRTLGWVRIRSAIENLIFSIFKSRVSEYMVQTPSMEAALRRRLNSPEAKIHVAPFLDYSMMPIKLDKQLGGAANVSEIEGVNWDFLYISDGVPHKNHINLITAWDILAKEGFYPSITLTLKADQDAKLINLIEQKKMSSGVKIVNIGQISHQDVLKTYGQCKAFLFASFAESFGIPLMEAKAANVPIIAAELDFVRDVCEPTLTFDPKSPVSISRAVKRFLEAESPQITPLTPELFNDKIISLMQDQNCSFSE